MAKDEAAIKDRVLKSYNELSKRRENWPNKYNIGYGYQFSPIELKRMFEMNGFRTIDCVSTAFNPYSNFDQLIQKQNLAKLKIYLGTMFGYLAQKV